MSKKCSMKCKIAVRKYEKKIKEDVYFYVWIKIGVSIFLIHKDIILL